MPVEKSLWQVKQDRSKLEEDILKLVREFESSCEMMIDNIELNRAQALDGKMPVVFVRIEVQL